MTSYALIDTDGHLHLKTGRWEDELGDHGFDRVSLTASRLPISGWVGDTSLLMPEIYPRNPVAAATLCCLGARVMPYAGAVVITGFRSWPQEPDACDLDPAVALYLSDLNSGVRIALGLDEGSLPNGSAEWAAQVREVAEIARQGVVPATRVSQGGAVVEVDDEDMSRVTAVIEAMQDLSGRDREAGQ